MLEISVFCVILLAAGYWLAMFVMGRHDDVIHGKFVHVDEEGDLTRPSMPAPPPPFPKRPVKAVQPARQPPANDLAAKPVNSEALQSLLAAIQQDLKSVA
ncbi:MULTISPECIES: hypothetical protein [Bradyrhizobium]|jgi:hypothetical protein|uniref:Uncharacterized protein n=1 Tax=Bradyrhizobium ottawaense TaxID=931866 RepID=A0A2U8PFP8_9BRAD|nr:MULTISPECIES: hypothetical protein [Bradyrhizobium]AWL96605.1 hypothetical protein CIT37_34125 [Bradyrhizobium ottawaense]MBR1290243.1 hypothetical protein [Bradyrhizobium ottawaense]MBR1326299.1 hypothetical protein [Bradyrhizobium ottawaense]MBR1332063.1 hypothetical protein [Bradyrhizobium ottawaense]MDA9420034.1 hypothetical protein [Bradyrhizobium sp. CCBAU 25360]